jgi:AcrR family transcriptional regulator
MTSSLAPPDGDDGSGVGGSPKRRRLGAADARETILAAAEALLLEEGPDGLRLTEVAARARVSHPNVLYHFGSVGELQTQLAQRVAVRLAERVAQAFENDVALSMSIESVVEAVFRVFAEGGYARLLAWLLLSGNRPNFEALAQRLEGIRSAIVAHPAMRGEEHDDRRRAVVPAIELVIASAVGYGVTVPLFEGSFALDGERSSVAAFLGRLLTTPAAPHLERSATPS